MPIEWMAANVNVYNVYYPFTERQTNTYMRVCGMEFQEQTSKIPNSHLYCHSVQIFSKKKTVCMCVNGFKNRRENEWMNESKFYDQ